MSGTPIRQDYLQTVLFWIASKEGKTIEQYMAEHQRDTHATPLKQYFKTVIDWVELTFPNYRSKLMKGLDWGLLYNQYSDNIYDPNQLEADIKQLLTDDDVTKQKGIYEYLLSGKTKEKALSQIQKKPVNKKVPEWYENTTQTKASEKSLQKALSLQKKLKGDKS